MKPVPKPKPTMNLIMLQLADFVAREVDATGNTKGIIQMLDQRRVEHIMSTLKTAVGGTLQLGEADGKLGTGIITEITPLPKDEQPKKKKNQANKATYVPHKIVVEVVLDKAPPPPCPVTLIIGLCRAKSFPKIIETCTVLGVKTIYVINTNRVEPGYWHTHTLQEDQIHERLTIGLEQTVDTVYPKVYLCKDLDRFMTKTLPRVMEGCDQNYVAHPDPEGVPCPRGVSAPCNLLIGPEGGFIDPEMERFKEAGFQTITLGDRILPVQTAVHIVLGKLSGDALD